MTELIGLIVVALSIATIVVFIFRGAAPAGSAPGRLFAGFGGIGDRGGFVGGLVGSFAVATTLSGTSAGAGGGSAAGALLAVAYFLLTRLRLPAGIRIVSGLVGTAGLVSLTVTVVSGQRCTAIPFWHRVLVIGLIVVAAALGTVASLMMGRPRIPSTLALFGALEIVVFVSSPLGVSLINLPVAAWIVAFAAAVLLGALGALAPQFVIGMTGAVIVVATVMSATTFGDTCTSGPAVQNLSSLAAFSVVYGLLTVTVGRWIRL